ncbi:MMPL family transporter [Thiorhodococcus mannitoliphagus]|uniref:MMPL family transporter n=1 Tax=Thiorhodococcus mannitoliphagus TaxID=329406 RepID=A0A6P1DXF2_9GAMM|nr:MMPL family transporter [Thiorhodococcus mannitoliphagus]NEX20394.1 MMPL family transporter [Thiorhodococcus mannitoliphagus]
MTARGRLLRIAGWLTAVGMLLVLVVKAEYSADMSVFLPRSPTPEQALLVDQLQEGTVSRLTLVAISGGDGAQRAQVSQAMAARLRASRAFDLVANGDEAALERDRVWLFEHRYLLSPAVDAQRFEVAGLREALMETLDWLVSPAGMLIEDLVPRDPTGELIQILERLDRGQQPRREHGIWVSRDGRQALLLVLTRASGADLDAQEAALAAIDAAFAAADDALPGATAFQLVKSGPGVFAVESRATIKGEVMRIALLATLVIVTLLLFVYRSVPVLLLGLLPVATGALAGIAAVSLGFGVVHGLTIGFGATLIGEAVDYGIYLFVQRGGLDSDQSTLSDLWPTIRIGLLTSVCGFGVMLGSGFPGLAQLGLYSTTGLIAAALVTRLVLPAFLPAKPKLRDLTPLGMVLGRALPALARLRWLVPVFCVTGLIVTWVHRDGLWNDSLLALSPVSPQAQALDARLRAEMGAPEASALLVIEAPDLETALRQAERVGRVLDGLVEEGAIAGWDGPAPFLPSLATQRARLASLPEPAVLASRLAVATVELPLKADRLEPFLADVERARAEAVIGPASLAGTSFALAVTSMMIETGQGWRVSLPLRAPFDPVGQLGIDAERVREALASVEHSNVVSLSLLELKAESDALYAAYLNEAIVLSLIGLAAILLLLSIALRSLARLWRVLLPLLTAVLTVTGALVLAGESLILMHLVGLLLVVAVGSNYALFFARGEAAPAPRTLASLLFANLTTLAGFGLLATSSVPVLQAIGITVGPGAVLALLFAAMLSRPRAAVNPD